MKKLSLAVITLFSVFSILAQSPANYNVRIYRSVSALNQLKADSAISLPVTTNKIRYGFWGITSKKRLTFYQTDITREAAKKLGIILAYTNNDSIFIKTGGRKMHHHNRFAQAVRVGNFLEYTDRAIYVDHHIPAIWFTYPQVMFLDYKSGRKLPLVGGAVRTVIKDNAGLFNKFKADKYRGKHLNDYLMAYSSANSALQVEAH